MEYSSPITDLKVSDAIGSQLSGSEARQVWNDYKFARLNQARNKVLLEKADIVIVRFTEQYRQFNSAFEAGFAVAQGKPLISWHDESLNHALKDIDSVSVAVAHNADEVVKALSFICC
ncbi:YtoQ family protein [Planctobacterium marinum]|uniref:YtoQ family protein n=1 Tax=Planctobacterium marinum TaxID=1631968 RepID=UPI001E2DD2EA|nr:YtoQ family protein [Planctobacterium marinum]MCC2607228.1 YtoQ family protein [Planctobacterium marinum]